ncbi:MAG: hypothetical protein QGH39_08440 [Candidatus Thermoplasmatota archaeon]|jgi:hypothetical protein|nr:hypothetical protein [Candidatus Thermoplasmatota archaeon]MDP7265572.1 hypothetical protein [Candidatus Thermoplasmatota archaeon]
MNSNNNIKKKLLISFIISLILSALIGIFIFLLGEFREVEVRLLLTTLTIGAYSLTGLCCAVIYEKKRFQPFAIVGIIISGLGLLYTLMFIWEGVDGGEGWKILVIFLILAFGIAHICLLLLIKSNKPLVNYSLIGTIICISILDFMLIILIKVEFDMEEFFFRLLGVFAILDVLGTIVTPILHKIYPDDSYIFQIVDE